jgi:K+-sensing histidine kinase KdpD
MPIFIIKYISARYLISVIPQQEYCTKKRVRMVKHQKIMVALGSDNMDLKSVHYALAAADRMKAQVFILKVNQPHEPDNNKNAWIEEAMLDLINSARQAGITISYHVADGPFEDEILSMVRAEGIDLVVLGEDEIHLNHSLLQFRSRIPGQVIQVKGKNGINYL